MTVLNKSHSFRDLNFDLPPDVASVLEAAPEVTRALSVEHLQELATAGAGPDGWKEVAYEVSGIGRVVEAKACALRNGVAANYLEPYMRRRDPDCMLIGDDHPTDKPTYRDRYGKDFSDLRQETFEWLKTQPLAFFPFVAGMPGKGMDAMVVAPANAGFFAMGLAMLQGLLKPDEVPDGFSPKAVIYVAPPFRHTHFDGKQIVIHNRDTSMHELFSYNLYPGPSAKKGIYGMLLNLGEEEQWLTMHCSTVRVVTPYGNRLVIAHEGASGGGKSEMLEHVHRMDDGALLIGRNVVTGDRRTLTLPLTCELRPVTDDMALCHPSLSKGRGKLSLMDAEDAWFVRVNHIERYGTDPHLEAMTVHPKSPLLFLNIAAQPQSTGLIWEHTEDEPGKPCPNPRLIIPRTAVDNIVDGAVDLDVRSFGVRCPPCTREHPSYGILGLFHILPPALAWLWRLVAPRGHANPSIVDTEGMSSEGVGSYWPFATGRKVDQANLLLDQIEKTPEVSYALIPNQHVGAWETGFMPQWIAREFLARRGGARFMKRSVAPARCPLLGWTPHKVIVEGRTIGSWFFEVDSQPEVGPEAYDAGAKILGEFFHQELKGFLSPDLSSLGREIIECCLANGSVDDYEKALPHSTLLENED